jgi:hypothetical protein
VLDVIPREGEASSRHQRRELIWASVGVPGSSAFADDDAGTPISLDSSPIRALLDSPQKFNPSPWEND